MTESPTARREYNAVSILEEAKYTGWIVVADHRAASQSRYITLQYRENIYSPLDYITLRLRFSTHGSVEATSNGWYSVCGGKRLRAVRRHLRKIAKTHTDSENHTPPTEGIKKMRLWLDDIRDPNTDFFQQEKGAYPGMLWVKTVEEAKQAMLDHDITFMSLDHDLGTKLTGYDFVKWVAEQVWHENIKLPKFAVHSDNAPAMLQMIQALYRIEDLIERRRKSKEH